MMSRELLIEVLESVNPNAKGVNYLHGWLLVWSAAALRKCDSDLIAIQVKDMRWLLDQPDVSPHFADLATEALHYLQEDARHG